MEYFKDKDTALKEIQTSDTKSSLGIPPREIRGTLNQIPQNSQKSGFPDSMFKKAI